LEIYYLGITAGTSATTYSPDNPMTRGQAAVFVSKGVNQALARSSRRAALGQWWTTTPHWDLGLGVTSVGNGPVHCATDGADVWLAENAFMTKNGTISRVRASDGRLLGTWTGAVGAWRVLVAMGQVFAIGISPGGLYMLDPTQPPGPVAAVASPGAFPTGITFDGVNIWTANSGGSVSIITPGSWAMTTVSGFSAPVGAIFDGTSVWITDHTAGTLLRLSQTGGTLQTVKVGAGPGQPAFDGSNIWVPNEDDDTVSVVRASDGSIVANLSGNGLSTPLQVAFDGERVLVTDYGSSAVSLWNAATLSPIGVFGSGPGVAYGACSDGANFWITLSNTNQLARV
jgi:hypothetical protein